MKGVYAMIDQPLPNFRGKAVTFYLVHAAPEHAITLDSPAFETQAGRTFVVGFGVPSGTADWAEGARMAVAWDQVAQYMVFESADDFTHRVKSNPGGFLGLFGSR